MKRLIEKTVRLGLVIAWRLAGSPTLRSPPSVNATTDGVVRWPSELGITTGSLPSMTDTQEFVVPKSIPMIFAIMLLGLIDCSFCSCRSSGGAFLCNLTLRRPKPPRPTPRRPSSRGSPLVCSKVIPNAAACQIDSLFDNSAAFSIFACAILAEGRQNGSWFRVRSPGFSRPVCRLSERSESADVAGWLGK